MNKKSIVARPVNTKEKLYTIAELSNKYNIKADTIFRWVRRGHISAIRKNDRLYISEFDIPSYLKQGKTRMQVFKEAVEGGVRS